MTEFPHNEFLARTKKCIYPYPNFASWLCVVASQVSFEPQILFTTIKSRLKLNLKKEFYFLSHRNLFIQFKCIFLYVYVIARVGVKFRINFTSVKLSGNKIARGEAECYSPLNLTRVKLVLEIS